MSVIMIVLMPVIMIVLMSVIMPVMGVFMLMSVIMPAMGVIMIMLMIMGRLRLIMLMQVFAIGQAQATGVKAVAAGFGPGLGACFRAYMAANNGGQGQAANMGFFWLIVVLMLIQGEY